jgi:hypothetical protein
MLGLQRISLWRVARPGEQPGEKGRIGTRRAKVWLDKSTRVAHSYTAYDQTPSVRLLTFSCPGSGGTASFDIGGIFQGEGLHGQSFLVEVKSYGSTSDPYPEYRRFLALCYMAYIEDAQRCDNFIFLGWRPFKSDKWEGLASVAEVIDAVISDRKRVFGEGLDVDAARAKVDLDIAAAVAQRLWLIVLNERQEQQLVITKLHYGMIVAHISMEAVS